jgi:hypothetical protein
VVGDIVDSGKAESGEGEDDRLGDASKIPNVNDIRAETFHRLPDGLIVMELQFPQGPDPQPGMPEESMYPQLALNAGLSRFLDCARQPMIRR